MTEKSSMVNFIGRIAEKQSSAVTPKEMTQIQTAIKKLSEKSNNASKDLVKILKKKLVDITLVQGPSRMGGKRKTRRQRKQRKTRRR